MISNCGHDERGKYSGGKAGDQTGTDEEKIEEQKEMFLEIKTL